MTANHGREPSQAGIEARSRVLLSAEIRGHAPVRMTCEEIAAYRRGPERLPDGWAPVRPSILRHSDDQTIAAVAAISQILHGTNAEGPKEFKDWGILAAPRFQGRAALVATLNRFRAEGVWGVTPHLIPHHALHSPAGTLSLILGTHGPNLGLGGGVHSATEGLLTALSWLESRIVPGVWLVFTGWTPEFRTDREGKQIPPAECQALAVALVPTDPAELPSPWRRPGLTTTAPHPDPPPRRGEGIIEKSFLPCGGGSGGGSDPGNMAGHSGPRIRMASLVKPEAPRPLDPMALARRLAAGDEAVVPPHRLRLHESHEGSIIPRPRLRRSDRSGAAAWIAAVDSTGRRRFELTAY